jgi:hypothetical protein
VPTLTQWVLFALAFGLLGAWVRRLHCRPSRPSPTRPYAAAHELISQLRVVSAPALLRPRHGYPRPRAARGRRPRPPHDRAVLLVRSGAGAFVPLTSTGFPELELDTSADDGHRLRRCGRQASRPLRSRALPGGPCGARTDGGASLARRRASVRPARAGRHQPAAGRGAGTGPRHRRAR